MFDLEQLSKLRFGMTEVPELVGQPGDYEEKWSQWFLERSFFRDFVYRNPQLKKGQELADAVVLFEDVVLMVQVKTQCGKHDPMSWTTEKMMEAFKQLCKTHENLVSGQIKKLKNDVYGDISVDSKCYPNRFGLIILAHDSEPYIAAKLAPEILTAGFPVHVFSLKDFAVVASRFDTAGDLINFLELRTDIAPKIQLFAQDETGNMTRMFPHVKDVYEKHLPGTSPEVLEKMAKRFEDVATGKMMESQDWIYSLSIDDMIARVHDVDPGLPWNENKADNRGSMEVARFLGWLTRDRRIRLGKRIISACEEAKDGKVQLLHHVQQSRGTVWITLVSSMSRPDRVKCLQFYVSYAHMKYGVKQCLGVATEPIGNGRSYDFVVTRTEPPKELIEQLKALDDPFSSEVPLF
jgi:hypothetical protein